METGERWRSRKGRLKSKVGEWKGREGGAAEITSRQAHVLSIIFAHLIDVLCFAIKTIEMCFKC